MPDPDLDTRSVRATSVAVAGCVMAVAVGWAAQVSGAVGTDTGRVLGRFDAGAGILFVLLGAAGAAAVLRRAAADQPPPPAREELRGLLRMVLLPWWIVVTVALFGYPTARGAVLPSDEAAATWVEVLREWLLVSPLRPPGGPPAAVMAGAGRLGQTWIITTIALAWLLLPVAERALRSAARRLGRDPAEVLVVVGLVAAVGGLGLRLAAATTDPWGWGTVARVMPPAQLDLLGVGVVTGVLVSRRGALASGAGGALLRLAAVVALALVAGVAAPGAPSALDPGGAGETLIARAGMALVGVALATWALRSPPALAGRSTSSVLPWVPAAVPGTLMVIPLVAQLWATRAGGPPGTQRVGPLVVVTVLGAIVVGLGLAALGRRVFGADGRARLDPFTVRLATITGLAMAWRLLTLVSINRRNPDGGDPFFYHHQANMLADRVGYSEPFRWVEQAIAVPSAIHPPLLSTWLASGSLLGARTFLAHKLLTAVLGVGVVVVGAVIARRLAGDRAALITAALLAVYPNLWVIDGALWPEGVYATTIGLAVLAAYRWWDRPDLGRVALLGLAIAVAAMARGEALFLYPLLVLPLVARRRGLSVGRKAGALAVAGLVGVVVLTPWTIRNLRAFDQPVLLSTNSDEVLYYANCEDSYRGEVVGYWSFNCQQRERARAGEEITSSEEADLYARCLPEWALDDWDGRVPGEPPGNEADKARYWRCLGVDYAVDNAERIPIVVAARIGRELDLYRPDQGIKFLQIEGRPREVARLGQVTWWVMAPLGLAGWWVLRRRRVLILPLVSLGVMVLATTVYAYGAVRFRTPLELGLLIGVGVLVDHLLARRKEAA